MAKYLWEMFTWCCCLTKLRTYNVGKETYTTLGAWLMQFPRKCIIRAERLNTYGIKVVHSIMTTEYDNQNTCVVAMMQLGMWQKKKEEEIQQRTSYVIARSNFIRWNQIEEHKKSSVMEENGRMSTKLPIELEIICKKKTQDSSYYPWHRKTKRKGNDWV
jgi:hypothetical protein